VCQALAVCVESHKPYAKQSEGKRQSKVNSTAWQTLRSHLSHFSCPSLVLLALAKQNTIHATLKDKGSLWQADESLRCISPSASSFPLPLPCRGRGRTRHLGRLNSMVLQLKRHEGFLLWRCCTKSSPPPQTSPWTAAEEGYPYQATGLLSPPCLAMCQNKHISGFLESHRQGLSLLHNCRMRFQGINVSAD